MSYKQYQNNQTVCQIVKLILIERRKKEKENLFLYSIYSKECRKCNIFGIINEHHV